MVFERESNVRGTEESKTKKRWKIRKLNFLIKRLKNIKYLGILKTANCKKKKMISQTKINLKTIYFRLYRSTS